MTCPDWRSLERRRDQRPEAWERALAHFDACPRCHDQALAVEPTLLFRRLPAPEVGGDEIAAMRQAVTALRRSEQASLRAATGWAGGLRAAALAAILITAALLQGALPVDRDWPGRDRPGLPMGLTVAENAAPGLAAFAGTAPASLALDRMPLVEDLDPAYGSVVQVVDDDLSLVLVLAPSDV